MIDRSTSGPRPRHAPQRRAFLAALVTGILLVSNTIVAPGVHASERLARFRLGLSTDWALYSAHGDGSGLRRIVTMDNGDFAGAGGIMSGFAWAPSGGALAYAANRCPSAVCNTGVGELRVVRADGSGARTILSLPSLFVTDPAWSPDGSRIAFEAVTAQPPCFCPGAPPTIHVTSRDGTTFFSVGPGWDPEWSPSGDKLAYNLGGRIHVVDLVDPTRSRVVSPPEVWAGASAWAPTGRKIAFIGSRLRQGQSSSRVWLVHVDGSRPRELPLKADSVAWSPSGKRLAVVTGAGISVANANGSRTRRLTREFGWGLTWVPDGSGLAFIESATASLYMVTLSGSSKRVLHSLPGLTTIAWRP